MEELKRDNPIVNDTIRVRVECRGALLMLMDVESHTKIDDIMTDMNKGLPDKCQRYVLRQHNCDLVLSPSCEIDVIRRDTRFLNTVTLCIAFTTPEIENNLNDAIGNILFRSQKP